MPNGYWFGTFAPQRLVFDIGFIHLYWYSVCVTAGIAVAALIARKQYLRWGGTEQHLIDFLFYAIIGGLIGARFWHVFIFQWGYYSHHLGEIVRIWEGGIAIQGALLGGLLAAYLYTRKRHIDFFALADSAVIGIPLAQAIGRWGNFFNQELYGLPTTMPWGIYIEPHNRVPGYENVTHFHPTFFYESVLNLLLFYLLWQYAKKKRARGSVTLLYFIGYSIIRFFVDFVRIDPMLMIGFLRASQVVSIICVLGAVVLWHMLAGRSVAK